MKCLASSSPRAMGGILDDVFSPKKAAEDWLAGQRQAVAGDLAYQRAMFVAQLRELASEATTEAAAKFAIAGVVAFGFSLLVYKLATRSR